MKYEKKLDEVYAKMRKLEESNEDGYIFCCYCGGMIKWELSVLAHYHKRRHKSLRWSEINCHPAHANCNNEDESHGDKQNYDKYLKSRYGNTILKEMELKKNSTVKFTENEIKEKIAYCSNRIIELKKLKRL